MMNIELTDVTRRFGHTQAVAGVSLETGPGVFGLLGPNGAGKTSLLRMMATVLPPSSGQLRLLGRDPGGYGPRREIRRRLGYLPQNLGYYPGFTVAEFVEYFALLKDMPPGRVPRAVAAAIEHVGLQAKARAKLRTLSGGMLRRAGIAQAVVNDPELLLLDEPTAGLDPEQRVAFRGLLRDLGQRATVVVSTHLVEDVGAACEQVALMDEGKIVFHGTPDELAARGEGTGAAGDAPLERGYSAVLAAARVRAGGAIVTAATAAPVRTRVPRPARVVPAGTARLLRIELRRNAMPLVLPLIAVLFWFDSYRPSTTPARAVGAAHVLEHGPGPHDHRLWAVRGRAWRPGWVPGTAGGTWPTWPLPRPGRAGRRNWSPGRPPRSGPSAATWCSPARCSVCTRPSMCRVSRPTGGSRWVRSRSPRSVRPGSRWARSSRAGSPRRWRRSAGSWP